MIPPPPPVKRYDMVTNYRCGESIDELEPADDGEWVRYEEVEALLLQRAQEIAELKKQHAHQLLCRDISHRREIAKQQCVQCAGAISAETGRCAECDEQDTSQIRDIETLEARVLELEAQLTARAQEIEQVQAQIERAFRAGYHCQWIRSERRYIFDPALKPGDPDGAFAAWQEADAALVSRAPQPEQEPMTAEETASHLADWIREWVQAEWELREFSNITVDEGEAVKRHARELADHLAAKLAFRAYLAAPLPASAALQALIVKWRSEAAAEQRVSFCADELEAALARADQP